MEDLQVPYTVPSKDTLSELEEEAKAIVAKQQGIHVRFSSMCLRGLLVGVLPCVHRCDRGPN